MSRYALIRDTDGLVLTHIAWDGETRFPLPPGTSLRYDDVPMAVTVPDVASPAPAKSGLRKWFLDTWWRRAIT